MIIGYHINFLQFEQTVIFNIEIALVFLVDSVVWIILLPVLIQQGRVDVILTFSSMIEHGMNLFFMLIE